MKFALIALLLLNCSLPAHAQGPSIGAGDVTGSVSLATGFTALSFLEAAFPAPRDTNLATLQADASEVLAGGPTSASLAEAFASLRSNEQLSGFDDRNLAELVLTGALVDPHKGQSFSCARNANGIGTTCGWQPFHCVPGPGGIGKVCR
jgi:hypothetical protein